MKGIISLILGSLSLLFGGVFMLNPEDEPAQEEIQTVLTEADPVDSLVTFKLTCVGDLMCHSPQFNVARIGKDSFDFSPSYAEVLPYLQSADFTFGNLETVFGGSTKPYIGFPHFNTPDDYAHGLTTAGFDFLSTANNHSIDQGAKGIARTLGILDQEGIAHSGTYTSEADRDSIRIVNIKGTLMAMLSYTYGTNGNPVPGDKPWLVNRIDSALIAVDISVAREAGADLVFVYFHFGVENQREPNHFQKAIVQHTIESGADIIIGSHPHVVQPMAFFKTQNAKLDSGFVAWSLGNFISNQYWRYTDAGIILNLELTKSVLTDSLWISDVSFVPTWVFRAKHEDQRQYVVMPAELGIQDSSRKWISNNWNEKMLQAFEDTKNTATKYSGRIRLESILEKDISNSFGFTEAE